MSEIKSSISNIILCGLPGCGKSTVGQIVASQLRWKFIDTDRLVEEAYFQKNKIRRSCREIAHAEGSESFRNWEQQAISNLKDCHQCVIATGGGAFNRHENRILLQSIARVIYLAESPHVLLPRICRNGIPSYLDPEDLDASFAKLIQERIPLYQTACHHVVDVNNKTAQDVAKLVCELLCT